jgi:carboxylesterase type B
MARELGKFYAPFNTLDFRAFEGLSRMMSDGTIGYGVHKFVQLTSQFTDVYYYKFSFVGRFSRFLYPRGQPYGVHHGDDIQYVLRASFLGAETIKIMDPEEITVERMTRIWVQFAKTG